MNSKPPKRRVLTAREKLMRKNYTITVKYTNGYAVYLQIDVKRFEINSFRTKKSEAEWTRDMLAIALAKIEL